MKISMIPDESLKTIHASQGDVGRKWEFEPYDNEGMLDVSQVMPQIIYPVSVGGTEQILPENGATPTTSPIIADIDYPDELRLNQQFTYRQVPSVLDGNAKVTRIQGNTLVWNQLIGDMTFVETSSGTTITKNQNGSYHVTGTATGNHLCQYQTTANPLFVLRDGHKYFYSYKGSKSGIVCQILTTGSGMSERYLILERGTDVKGILVYSHQAGYTNYNMRFYSENGFTGSTDIFVQLMDLTQMFGSGNEPTVAQFETFLANNYPLPYYTYNTGTLLSFNGTDIKTVGFNQWDEVTEAGSFNTTTGANVTEANRFRTKNYILIKPNTNYYCYFPSTTVSIWTMFFDINKNVVTSLPSGLPSANNVVNIRNAQFTTPSNACYLRFYVTTAEYGNNICLNISDPNLNGTYEPYTSTTTPLPTSSYFPTGMKSAGSVYDEFSENKVATRVGTRAYQSGDEDDSTLTTDGTNTNYPLSTPIVITSYNASLITQGQEVSMSVEDDKLVAYSTEQITQNAGFHDCKIKLTDSDGNVAYSTRFRLHTERKP